jgi:hypothetical protein
MKHTWKAALAVTAVAMIGTAGTARADLTLDGQTGLFINPTAEVAKKGDAEVAVNYQRANVDIFDGRISTYGIGGAVGVADKLELSANFNKLKLNSDLGDTDSNDWRIGGKYQLFNQSEKGFDLAVGANYERIDGEGGNDNHYTAYLAGTKNFASSSTRAPIQGTLGVRWDRVTVPYSDDSSKVSVYAGANVPLTRTGDFSLVAEVGTKTLETIAGQDASTPYAIGLRYRPKASGFSAGIGFGRPSIVTQQELVGTSWFAQIGYAFGK